LFYCKGQKYESKRFLRLTSHCYQEHKNNPFFLAIHSFALELSAKYEESLQTAKRAIQLNEKNPWAHHTLSHVYINKGLINEGIRVLEHYAPMWKEFSHLIESHNLWHLALLYLEDLNLEKVQEIYQRADWMHQSQLVGEQIDATALLWRLDLEMGHYDSAHWLKLAESIGDHANFGATPFISAQLCYALKRGKREEALNEALKNIENFAQEQIKEDRYVWKEVGLPLIYGSLAFADNDYATTLQHFDSIISKIGCGGGSDAQIALFDETYLKSLIGVQRTWDAENFLHKMTQGRDLTKLERKWLTECQKASISSLRAAI
jgi:tetratricopeptide (TPR) repeat protein